MSFNRAILQTYARHKSPSNLPPNIYFQHTEDTVTIFDAYPKAKFHFLVLPRVREGSYSASNLTSLKKLLASPQAGKEKAYELIQKIKDDAQDVKESIEGEMMERFGFKWQIHMGFHAVQSMDHIHLHVISEELCSPGMKTKKHYNSFHPKLGFFLHIDDVLSWFDSDKSESFYKSMISLDETSYEKKLKKPLECFRCGKELKNMPVLKAHLEEHFSRDAKAFANEAPDTEPKTSSRKRKVEDVDDSKVTTRFGDTNTEIHAEKKQRPSHGEVLDLVEN